MAKGVEGKEHGGDKANENNNDDVDDDNNDDQEVDDDVRVKIHVTGAGACKSNPCGGEEKGICTERNDHQGQQGYECWCAQGKGGEGWRSGVV